MSNDPIESKPIQTPNKNKIILVIIILLLLLILGLGIYWILNNKNKVNDNQAPSQSQKTQTDKPLSYFLKGDNETISITPPEYIYDLKIKDPAEYQKVKEIMTEDVLFLVDYSKTQQFIFKQGQTTFYAVQPQFTKGATPQEKQDNLYNVLLKGNEISKQKDTYEKTKVNTYLAIKHIFSKEENSTANIVEYYIFGQKDVFTIMQTYTDGLSPEADLLEIIDSVKIISN